MKPYLFLLVIAAVQMGCQDDTFREDDATGAYNPQQVICMSVVPEPTDSLSTRGTPISSVTGMTDMGTFCAYTAANDWSIAALPQKMFNTRLERNVTTGNWEYKPSAPVEWGANNSKDRYTFFAYAPYAAAANGIVVEGSATTAGIPSITYTAPTDAALQPDLMTASPRYNQSPASSMVSLQMKHTLTCVGFQVQGNGQKIKSLTLSGISTRGKLPLNGDNIVWDLSNQPASPSSYSPLINYDPGQTYYTAKPIISTNLLTGNGYLMMIPQTLTNSAKLIITLVGGANYSIPLNSQTWQAGKKVTYNILLNNNGVIVVSNPAMYVRHLGSTAQLDSLSISCQPANLSWKISSNSDWLRLSTDATGSGAAKTISGTGSTSLYTIVDSNPNLNDRIANIRLNGNSSSEDLETNYVTIATITQLKYINPTSYANGGGLVLNGTFSYVGAFWRANQTGERIIRTPVGTNTGNTGAWVASVIWMDANWTANDILLSTKRTKDTNLSFVNAEATPGDAELFPVTDNYTVASGSVLNNGVVHFRIGLRSRYTPTSNAPARYAVIALEYENRTKTHLIFLRQGEGADYVMRPTDASTGDYISSSRPLARKMPPYNLTVPSSILSNWVGGGLLSNHPQLSTQGTSFVEFPTQNGAFFQWASIDQLRRAYHPVIPQGATIQPWSILYSPSFWNLPVAGSTLSSIHEVSPDKYRRINDGSETGLSTGKTNASELRQSLFYTTKDGSASIAGNTISGYYADGFFDRRYVVPINTSKACAVSYFGSILTPRNANIAYVGTVIFNPINWASLFFPAGGCRDNDSALANVGYLGYYWTSSCQRAGDFGTSFVISAEFAPSVPSTDFNKQQAHCIRPILIP